MRFEFEICIIQGFRNFPDRLLRHFDDKAHMSVTNVTDKIRCILDKVQIKDHIYILVGHRILDMQQQAVL